MDLITHYDLLIEENNDPFRDPPELRAYMDKWDGPIFLQALELDPDKRVLEIGIGTGRLAVQTAPHCMHLTGIDLSPKTIARARENLIDHPNITYLCDDFRSHLFSETFDVIYSSLTMMHFEDKLGVIAKVGSLLDPGGIFCLSIDKNQSAYLDMGTRRIQIYPDSPERIIPHIHASSMKVARVLETEHAYIIVSRKSLPLLSKTDCVCSNTGFLT